jgi:phosphomannomutase
VRIPGELRDAATAWISDDPDPTTRDELTALLQRADVDEVAHQELADRFASRLEFGTAGLRGELAAGPNRMNRVVVTQAAAGLGAYLLDTVGTGSVVIGYDARYNSEVFATDTAAVLAGAGMTPVMLPGPLPTPVLAFAIRHLRCIAGVMVTASHNPARDNGYKVYLGDGSQIVPPADAEIAAGIVAAGPAARIARAEKWDIVDDAVVAAYVQAVAGLAHDGPRDLTVVYTPLHGVGGPLVSRVLERAGFGHPLVVPEQSAPDPKFPTVAFPNPEEPGALDLAMRLATTTAADIVFANDPDADRCAAAVPYQDGSWRMLRGDEVGVLLADHLLRRDVRGVYATTIVSSSQLKLLAEDYGASYAETLTGFKWLSRVPGLAYAYEEALGYCVAPRLVRDKDGVSALLLLAELAAELRTEGRTLLDRLDDLAERYGVHATDQLSVRVSERALIRRAMQRLRDSPPQEMGGLGVERVDDLSVGSAQLPPTEGLRYTLSSGGRVIVRPSGTEPKLKGYLEVVVPVDGSDVAGARRQAADRLLAVRSELASILEL